MKLTLNYENEADEILQYRHMHYNCHLNQNVDSFEDHLNIQLNVLEMNIDSKKWILLKLLFLLFKQTEKAELLPGVT